MRWIRLGLLAGTLLALCACSGAGGIGSIIGNSGLLQCNPGTQVQLANPTPGQGGVNGNIGSVTIVASGNNNPLYGSYNQWNLILTDNFGGRVNGGRLSLVPYPSGPHPFASDFYYSSSIPALAGGRTWNAQLQQTSANCSPYPLNSFST